MADTTALKNRIRAAIKANDNQEITGPVLQQALLDIVDELDLYPELENESQQRQNADTGLNNLITGIKNNIDNGYVYAGIATPSTTPVSGKVFYLALTAGTYTNFGGQVLTQGINILRYTGSAWNNQQLIGIDDFPTVGSGNLAKSNGVFQDVRRSPSDIRGLDFSSYTGNVEGYTKGILFAAIVPASGYIPDCAEIFALAKNNNNEGYFDFWVWLGDNSHKFTSRITLSTAKNIVYIKESKSYATLYAIIDISKYADGENVIWGGTLGKRVSIELVGANDPRICNWQNEYVESAFSSLILTDANAQPSPSNIDLTLKKGSSTLTHLVLPSATDERAGLLSAKEKRYINSEENVRGLDFRNYTGDKSLYTKGIIFAGVVLADGFTPQEVTIYALTKNKNNDGAFNFWIWFGVDANHTIILQRGLSLLRNGVNYLKIENSYGTLYLIVDISKYADGEVVVFNSRDAAVIVNTITADDPRIRNWQYEWIDINLEISNALKEVTSEVKTNIAATELFLGIYDKKGNLSTSYERYSALYPVEAGKTYLYTNTQYPHVGVAAFDLVFLDSSRNFIDGIPINTQATYSDYRITITNPSIAYIAAIAGDVSGSNNSSLKAISYTPNEDDYSKIIQSQFRLLDFSNLTRARKPYYESVIFAAVVWKNKPEGAVKPEIYALCYNYNESLANRIILAIRWGNIGGSNQSLWVNLDTTQWDSIPEYYFGKATDTNNVLDFYYIISPKALVNYYSTYHKPIAWGAPYGTNVRTEELAADDPRIAMFNVASQISALNTRIDNIVTHSVFWNNKKLVWYGTSIPAGSDPTLGQEGIGITYPQITASYLGATCNNEAVGSGRASYLAPVQNETYQHLMRCQGGTIASKLSLFNDIYVIDDDNETVTLGPNTYGIRELPVSGTPTYAQAVSLRLEAIRFSYEIKLISRYLDSTNQYLQGVLNSQEVAASIHYSGTGYELLHREDMDYKFTPDLFVFDHGTNDYGHMSNNDDVTSRDTTKFYGAMNMMYDLIQFYAPTSLVCIVTDYGTSRYNSDLVIKEQQAWADYWQIPCLRTCDIIPWNGTIVTVQGYWDGGTAQGGQWHNEGFYFTVNGNTWETNNGIILRAHNSNTPASTIISRYNIRTIRGKQVYDIQQKYKFFKDGLHPHTDTSGNALKLYARYLSRLIETNVAPNRD